MSLLINIPAPRKLDEIPRDLMQLATRTRTFSEDVFEAFRMQRQEAARIVNAVEALQAAGSGGGGGSVTFGSPVGLDVGGANVDGVSTNAAHADHEHAIARGTPVGLTPGGANAAGSSGDFADASHTHALAAFGSSAGTFCEGNDVRLLGTNDYTTVWMPDAAPASPHADDDECDGAGIAGAWTVWDPHPFQTETANAAEKHYRLSGPGPAVGNTIWGGLYKAVPASVFSITAKLSFLTASGGNGDLRIGLMAADLTTPSTGPFRNIHLSSVPATTRVSVLTDTRATYTSATGAVTASTTATNVQNVAYLRLRCNGTVCASDWSHDGLTWRQLVSVTLAYTPLHAGICFSLGNAVVGDGYVHWVRFRSGAGADSMLQTRAGRLVRVPT